VFIYSIVVHPQTHLSKLQYIAEIATFSKWIIKTNILKTSPDATGSFGGLAPQKQSSKPPQIEI